MTLLGTVVLLSPIQIKGKMISLITSKVVASSAAGGGAGTDSA